MSVDIICPECRKIIKKDIFSQGYDDLLCQKCKVYFPNFDGCYDFSAKNGERVHYNNEYTFLKNDKRNLDFGELEKLWLDDAVPERKNYLESLPELSNKVVLLLGNGTSTRELYFLKLGAKIIYSDIAINAITLMKNQFDFGQYKHSIVFHALDARRIPYSNDSVDVILGFAFVHHLENLNQFFMEIRRVLRPGGVCRFFDNAYSPILQTLKFTLLKPLMNYCHKRCSISPEDKRATERGGYKEEEIITIENKLGFAAHYFHRFGLSYYLLKRGSDKLFPGCRKYAYKFVKYLFKADQFLSSKFRIYHENTINLVWGMEKRREL